MLIGLAQSRFNMNTPYVLILAGGSGERFWPLSRSYRPKHLLRLLSDKTLLEETVERLEGFVPQDRVIILTSSAQIEEIRSLLPGVPTENIVAEPAKRDTAPAVALGVGLVARLDPQATMIMLPADHIIQDRAGFIADLRLAAEAAQSTGAIVTLGIPPTWACPGFGYIEEGESTDLAGHDLPVGKLRHVVRFREKPNAELAETFFNSGNFRWNAGIFIWTIPSILCELQRHQIQLAQFVADLRTTTDIQALLDSVFPGLPKISIDYAVMEQASSVLAVRAGFDWDDVGSWTALTKYLPADSDSNHGNTTIFQKDSSHNLVFSENGLPIALVGVNDLIVVQAKDAILICNRHDAQDIKAIIPLLPPELT